jgi:hypothetical protein
LKISLRLAVHDQFKIGSIAVNNTHTMCTGDNLSSKFLAIYYKATVCTAVKFYRDLVKPPYPLT